MSRTLVSLLALGLLASCGSKQKTDGVMSEKTLESTMGITEEDKQPAATEFVEVEGCAVEVTPLIPEGDQPEYMQATEQALTGSRMEFAKWCGNQVPVEVDWTNVFLSAGFDDGEAPGAVSTTADTYLRATAGVCDELGATWRDQVKRVVLEPTDTADRVGLCFDETEGVVVYRFMLTPGDGAASGLEGDAISGWYAENL